MRTLPATDHEPRSVEDRLAILDRVDEILELRHRTAELGIFEDPLAGAVYILLSRQVRDAGHQRLHRELQLRWATWDEVLTAPTDVLADALRPAGFGPTHAAQIQGLLAAVATECARRGVQGPVTLDWLRELPDDEVERYLTSLPGMGPKSARCVMHYSLGRSALAIDTHVRRVLDRLGLVKDPESKVNHDNYETAVSASMPQRLHVNLIHHGRAYCMATSPRCDECPLISFCASGRARQREESDTPIAIELFAGGGGLGEGFNRAGFRIAIAVEMDRNAAQTYRLNHPGTVVLEADAMKISANDLKSLAPLVDKASAIIAGPPCQGYSAAGKRKADDEKNKLYRAVVRMAGDLKPRFVVIENVPGMQKVEGRSFVETVLNELRHQGYSVNAHLLRACDFGVPQLRRRMLFIAQRAEIGPAPEPPAASHCPGFHCEMRCGADRGSKCMRKPTPTVLESLAGLPILEHSQFAEYVPMPNGKALLNGSTMRHSQRVIDKIASIRPGTGPISYRRLHPDLARTIVAGHRALPVHPIANRSISVREAARIQGFPDEHIFAGPRGNQPLQVANAVPPALANAVATALLKAPIWPASELTARQPQSLSTGRSTTTADSNISASENARPLEILRPYDQSAVLSARKDQLPPPTKSRQQAACQEQ